MKRIKLVNYSKPVPDSFRSVDQLYCVSLGNGYKVQFASEKETKAFLSETNRELNTKLYELNFLYSDMLRLYRSSWLYFEPGKISGLANIESLCNQKMQAIENSFNLLVDRSGFENGNHLVFSHFQSIIEQIKSVCDLLAMIFTKRGLTSSLYECNSFVLRAEYIATSITIYPNKIKLVADRLQPFQLKKVV